MTVSGGMRPEPAGVDGSAGSTTDPHAAARAVEGAQPRWRARLVTYGLVVGLVVGAGAEVEHWPATSFRLFSVVRTDRSFGLELVAITAGGDRTRVELAGGNEVVANPTHQLQRLRTEPSELRRTRVHAWLELTGMDPAAYRTVLLERVERRLDPDGGPSTEVRRTVVAEVEL